MRPLLAVLALVALATPARADPPRFEFDLQNVFLGLDRPFTFGLLRAGDWDIESVKEGGYTIGGVQFVTARVQLDGITIASPFLAYHDHRDTSPNNFWTFGTGWQIAVPGLAAGPHRIVVEYGDFWNRPAPAVWDFSILNIPVPTQPISLLPRPLTPRDGVDPESVPATGFVLLTDADTGSILVKPIEDLLVEDPDTGRRELDLSFLPADTVVTYSGDANYPAFNFTYNAPETPVPAPAAPFALALAVLAVARWRRVQRSLPVPSRRALSFPALMLPAFLLLALLLAPTARAAPPAFEFLPPTMPYGVGTPFSVELRRIGDWNEEALKAKAETYEFFDYAWISVVIDGSPLANLTLALGPQEPPYQTGWLLPRGWIVTLPGLNFGDHQLTASYVGDTVNTPALAIWNFSLFAPAPNIPSLFPTVRKPFPGISPVTTPTGFITLTDIETLHISLRPIETVLTTDPVSGERSLDLSFLPADTLVSYPGDANHPSFNFTYDAPEQVATPAPAAPLPLALLALAALRLGRPRLLHSRRDSGAPQCRMPTSSTCASTPPIR